MSLLTNSAAMTALQTLASTNKSLESTQNRISTGLRVSDASDNAAYWSIATTMKSDNKALSAVQDSLGLGANKVDTAYTAMNAAKDTVDQIKTKIITARGVSAGDRGKIQDEIKALQSDLGSKSLASFSGDNWLNIDTTAASGDAANGKSVSIVSSFDRKADGTVSVGKIDVELYNSTTGDTIALFDKNATAANKKGILDTEFVVQAAVAGPPAVAEVRASIATLDVSAAGLTDAGFDAMLAGVEAALGKMTSAASDLGAAKSRINLQKDFVSKLSDSIDKGVGALVDADMNKESARLSALQVQQQLGVQALSIANSGNQQLLSLFRG
ncbi:flagellin [Phyllobacterium leguminum]|uniref:Flagellin n=1 Tax=Phyllobacterium leguminum TaxID=314237 RepID=A0A318TA81_9HYPH|nr:flagellin [Phyllobacterium leguminum]PYE87697.1 flagellin [Phyllobacterium leguminum]